MSRYCGNIGDIDRLSLYNPHLVQRSSDPGVIHQATWCCNPLDCYSLLSLKAEQFVCFILIRFLIDCMYIVSLTKRIKREQQLPVECQIIANKARHSVTDWTATRNGIRWRHADERRLFEKCNFEMKFIRTVFWWRVTPTGPNDITNIKSLWLFPWIPIANLRS